MTKGKRDEEEEEYYYPRTEEELIEDLCEMYNNGLGEKEITDLIGRLATDHPLLAKTIFEELTYWNNHAKNNNNKI